MSLLLKFLDRFRSRKAQSGFRDSDEADGVTVYDTGSSGSHTQEGQPSNPEKVPRRKPFQPGNIIEDFKPDVVYKSTQPPIPEPANLSFGQPSQGPSSGIRPRTQSEPSQIEVAPAMERFRAFDWQERFWPEDEYRTPVPRRKQKIDWFGGVQDGAGSQIMTVEQVRRFSKKVADRMEKFGVYKVDRDLFFSRLLLGER